MIRYITHTVLFLLILGYQVEKLEGQQVCPGEPGLITWEYFSNIPDDDLSDLLMLENYPLRPDTSFVLYSTDVPNNYDDFFGTRVRGFITVPSNTTATFNLTGNRRAEFYLSSDSDPANLSLRCSVIRSTGDTEHNDTTFQTSSTTNLMAGVDYYFEIIHVDGWGSDHVQLYWKTPLVSDTTWNIVRADYLKNIGCIPPQCPDRGTPCDDGNASTANDQEDGFCNCQGTPAATATLKIGDRAKISQYLYEGINGSDIEDLTMAPNFPALPNTVHYLRDDFLFYEDDSRDNYGSFVQAYFIPPVSGNYRFALAGDDETVFYISSDDSPANKMANSVFVPGWSRRTELDKYPEQQSGDIYLNAGQVYYVELAHKEGGGGDHFSLYWKTPQAGYDIWKLMPSFYFWDYTGEMVNIPVGTTCDDGLLSTENDVIIEGGGCSGTPCENGDCNGQSADYQEMDKCGATDKLLNAPGDQWLSCDTAPSPKDNSNSHWIMYDLGQVYNVYNSQVWNYNVQNEVGNGFRQVEVAYSEDGSAWQVLEISNWPLATGSEGYTGFTGPNFGGASAQYILFTSTDNDTSCKGLGKVAFTTISCSSAGLACDDGNEATFDDIYDENCECNGFTIEENDCGQTMVNLDNSMIGTSRHAAVQSVTSESIIQAAGTVGFIGGESVILEPGFESQPGAVFIASIDPCTNNVAERIDVMARSYKEKEVVAAEEIEKLIIQDPLDDGNFIVQYIIDNPGLCKLTIEKGGREMHSLAFAKLRNGGNFYKNLNTHALENGVYEVKLTTADYTISKKLVIAR